MIVVPGRTIALSLSTRPEQVVLVRRPEGDNLPRPGRWIPGNVFRMVQFTVRVDPYILHDV
jgi:hypothetical protein